MTLFISVPEARSQRPPDERRLSIRQSWTIPSIDATGKSHGYRQTFNLRPGLNVLIDDYTLQDDLVVDYGENKPCAPQQHLELSFMLSGHNHQEGVQLQHSFIVAAWRDSFGGQFPWQADEHVLKFDIHIGSVLFATLVGEQFDALPPLLRQIIQESCPSQEWFVNVQTMTAAMQSAIQQILQCPYQGLTRWLYLESKVLELIALRLDQVSQHQPAALVTPGLQPEDIDRIYDASTLLLQRLANPPSLMELARLVGLNDYKLKQGFRHIFGTTVFSYLQAHRMERAKQLLAEPTFNIAGVAQAMGYASQSYFCRMFKQQFGITPRSYRDSLRR